MQVRTILFLLASALVVPSLITHAQTGRSGAPAPAAASASAPSTSAKPSTPGTAGTPLVAVNSESAYLKITLDASRSPIAMDTAAGLSAEIKNVSTVAVKLYENETIFVTMPETRVYGSGPYVILGCATFPTQGNVRPEKRPDRGYDLLMQPGDTYRVFWDMTQNGCTGAGQLKDRIWTHPLGWAEDKWQRIAFKPGTYRAYMDVVFYPQDQTPYRSVTEGRDVQVTASQQMVLLGAFLGGVLSYVIKVYYAVDTALTVKTESEFAKRLLGSTEWFFAGLFGAAMAILASRLSDTFPVKVSADDFWGAITLGFVFQWIGVKLLEKLPGMDGSRTAKTTSTTVIKQSTTTQPPPPNPPPTPGI